MGMRVPAGNRYSSPRVDRNLGRPAQVAAVGNAETFNAGPSLDRAMDASLQAASRYKQEADQVAALEGKTRLAAAQTRLLYDPEVGAFNKKGKNAFGTIDEVNTAYQKEYDEILKTMHNESQREALRREFEVSKLDINRQLSRHISTQADQYDDTVTTAGLVVEQQAVIANPLDTERRNQAMLKQKIMIDQYADRKGLPAEQRQIMLTEAENKTDLGAITALVDSQDYLGAQEYYESVKNNLTGDYKTKAERLVKESIVTGQANANAMAYAQKNMSFADSVAQAQKIEDPNVRKATFELLKQNNEMKKIADADRDEKLIDQIASRIDRGQTWNQIPQSEKDSLSMSDRNRIKAYADERAKGNDAPAGSVLYFDAIQIAGNPATRQQFMKMNLKTEYYGKIATSEMKELVTLQMEMRNGTDKGTADADQIFTTKQIVEGIARSAGIYADKDSGKSAQESYAKFQAAVNNAARQYTANTGKKPDGVQLQKIVDSLLIEQKVNNDWFNNTRRRFELDTTQNSNISYDQIPESERSQIEAAAKRHGYPISQGEVVEFYNKMITGAL